MPYMSTLTPTSTTPGRLEGSPDWQSQTGRVWEFEFRSRSWFPEGSDPNPGGGGRSNPEFGSGPRAVNGASGLFLYVLMVKPC